MEIQKSTIIALLSSSIADSLLGIYPKSINDGKNGYKKRTQQMEGHNACMMKLSKYKINIEKFCKDLTEDVLILLINGKLSISESENEKYELYINCNDLFFWGCGDAELITLEEISELLEYLKLSSKHGELLWVARKRKMRPQPAYYDYFDDNEKILFNGCGPERSDN
jgi:hypothetical protein